MGFSETDVASQKSGALAPLVSLFFLRENLPNSGDLFLYVEECRRRDTFNRSPSQFLRDTPTFLPRKIQPGARNRLFGKGKGDKTFAGSCFPILPRPNTAKRRVEWNAELLTSGKEEEEGTFQQQRALPHISPLAQQCAHLSHFLGGGGKGGAHLLSPFSNGLFATPRDQKFRHLILRRLTGMQSAGFQ